jgi:hypothetical protein
MVRPESDSESDNRDVSALCQLCHSALPGSLLLVVLAAFITLHIRDSDT